MEPVQCEDGPAERCKVCQSREETNGRFWKRVVLANVPSFLFFGTVGPFFVPLFRFLVPSFLFYTLVAVLGVREHPREHPPDHPFIRDGPNTTTTIIFQKSFASDATSKRHLMAHQMKNLCVFSVHDCVEGAFGAASGGTPKMKNGAPRDELKNGCGRGWAVA